MVAISNLKVLRLALKYTETVQHTADPTLIDEEWIDAMDFVVQHHELVSKTKVDQSKLPKTTMNDWAKTKERIVDHFTGIFGAYGVPLAYILRETSQVKDEEEDPEENYYDDDLTCNHIKELINRAAHEGQPYGVIIVLFVC